MQLLQTAPIVNKPWLSLALDEGPIKSLGVYCEETADELWIRQAAINAFYGIDFQTLDGCDWISRKGEDNILMTISARGRPELTPLHGQLIQQCREEGKKLFIWDSISDGYIGNENDRGLARQFVQFALTSIAIGIGGTCVATAHPSQAGMASGSGTSGSTGWNNAFRARMFLDVIRDKDGKEDAEKFDRRILRRKKSNYGPRNEDLELVWKDNIFQTKFQATGAQFHRRPVEDVFLSVLDEAIRQNRHVSASSPTELCAAPVRENDRRRRLQRIPFRARYGTAL
jgi:RecA-family ATPase